MIKYEAPEFKIMEFKHDESIMLDKLSSVLADTDMQVVDISSLSS